MDKKEILEEIRGLTVAFTIGATAVCGPIALVDYLMPGCGPSDRLIGKIWKTECSVPKGP